MRKWHPHFTRAPLAPITALAQVKCREHARPCQTRAISRSEKKSRRSVGNIARDCRFKDVRIAACATRKWHSHFTRAPLAPITALAQVKCREHARPCQTRVISRSEKKSRRSVGNIREIVPLQRRENAACASGIHTLHAPPRSNYSPGAGKVQGACAAMPKSHHQSL